MPKPPPQTPLHHAITQQHQELSTLIDDLRTTVARPSRDRDALQDAIHNLTELVTHHFECEEDGGYFSDAVERAPRLHTHALELCLRHEALSEQLNSLARSGVESPVWWQQIENDTERFIASLLDHEADEKAMLQQAYSEDLGTGD